MDSVFGQPLDKRLQCSSWGCRPLSAEQVSRSRPACNQVTFRTPWPETDPDMRAPCRKRMPLWMLPASLASCNSTSRAACSQAPPQPLMTAAGQMRTWQQRTGEASMQPQECARLGRPQVLGRPKLRAYVSAASMPAAVRNWLADCKIAFISAGVVRRVQACAKASVLSHGWDTALEPCF